MMNIPRWKGLPNGFYKDEAMAGDEGLNLDAYYLECLSFAMKFVP